MKARHAARCHSVDLTKSARGDNLAITLKSQGIDGSSASVEKEESGTPAGHAGR